MVKKIYTEGLQIVRFITKRSVDATRIFSISNAILFSNLCHDNNYTDCVSCKEFI